MTRLKSFYSLRQKAKVQFLRYLLLWRSMRLQSKRLNAWNQLSDLINLIFFFKWTKMKKKEQYYSLFSSRWGVLPICFRSAKLLLCKSKKKDDFTVFFFSNQMTLNQVMFKNNCRHVRSFKACVRKGLRVRTSRKINLIGRKMKEKIENKKTNSWGSHTYIVLPLHFSVLKGHESKKYELLNFLLVFIY